MIYFPYKEKDSGVLHYFWEKKKNSYYSYVNATASSTCNTTGSWEPQNVIDWSTAHYWFPDLKAYPTEQYHITCFTQHKIRLIGYELLTSKNTCKMQNWRITASQDWIDWPILDDESNIQTKQYTFTSSASEYFEFDTKIPYRCFKFQHSYRNNQCKSGFDLNKVDYYGYLYPLEQSTLVSSLYNPKQFIILTIIIIN